MNVRHTLHTNTCPEGFTTVSNGNRYLSSIYKAHRTVFSETWRHRTSNGRWGDSPVWCLGGRIEMSRITCPKPKTFILVLTLDEERRRVFLDASALTIFSEVQARKYVQWWLVQCVVINVSEMWFFEKYRRCLLVLLFVGFSERTSCQGNRLFFLLTDLEHIAEDFYRFRQVPDRLRLLKGSEKKERTV